MIDNYAVKKRPRTLKITNKLIEMEKIIVHQHYYLAEIKTNSNINQSMFVNFDRLIFLCNKKITNFVTFDILKIIH